MGGNSVLFDTNVLIRFLTGDRSLIRVIDEADKYVSFLTEIELFSKPGLSDAEHTSIAELLTACLVLPYRDEMREKIILLRKEYRLKMPDAFIAATALHFNLPLFTFDKAFRTVEGLNLFLPA